MTQICVSKLSTIGSDNGLSPSRRQAIIWTNVGILLIRTIGTNFSEILSEIRLSSFTKMDLKMSSAKWRWFCLGLIVLNVDVHGPSCLGNRILRVVSVVSVQYLEELQFHGSKIISIVIVIIFILSPFCYQTYLFPETHHIDGLKQKIRNFVANALELRLFCAKPSGLVQKNVTLLPMHCMELRFSCAKPSMYDC